MCAVAVRYDNDVVVIDYCRQSKDVEWNGETYANQSLTYTYYQGHFLTRQSVTDIMKTFDDKSYVEVHIVYLQAESVCTSSNFLRAGQQLVKHLSLSLSLSVMPRAL